MQAIKQKKCIKPQSDSEIRQEKTSSMPQMRQKYQFMNIILILSEIKKVN